MINLVFSNAGEWCYRRVWIQEINGLLSINRGEAVTILCGIHSSLYVTGETAIRGASANLIKVRSCRKVASENVLYAWFFRLARNLSLILGQEGAFWGARRECQRLINQDICSVCLLP